MRKPRPAHLAKPVLEWQERDRASSAVAKATPLSRWLRPPLRRADSGTLRGRCRSQPARGRRAASRRPRPLAGEGGDQNRDWATHRARNSVLRFIQAPAKVFKLLMPKVRRVRLA